MLAWGCCCNVSAAEAIAAPFRCGAWYSGSSMCLGTIPLKSLCGVTCYGRLSRVTHALEKMIMHSFLPQPGRFGPVETRAGRKGGVPFFAVSYASKGADIAEASKQLYDVFPMVISFCRNFGSSAWT